MRQSLEQHEQVPSTPWVRSSWRRRLVHVKMAYGQLFPLQVLRRLRGYASLRDVDGSEHHCFLCDGLLGCTFHLGGEEVAELLPLLCTGLRIQPTSTKSGPHTVYLRSGKVIHGTVAC